MIIVIPVILILKAIIALVHALANIKTPEKATAKVSAKLPGLLSVLFIIILFQCALPQIDLAWGAIAMLVITTISIVMNSIIIRIPAYRKEDMMYANIAQGTSLVGIIGFLIFFFNLIKTGILTSFLKGPFFTFMQEFDKMDKIYESDYVIDSILMLFYICFAFVAINYISKVTRRLSLSCKNGGSFIALPILTLSVFILPTVIKSTQHLNIIDDGEVIFEASSLYLTDSGETALIFVLVGIIIMLLAEIAFWVIPKILCKNMTSEEKHLVLSGTIPQIDGTPTQENQENVQENEQEATQESEQEATQESEQETTQESEQEATQESN